MKCIGLAALTGALAISTVGLAIDVASAAPRDGAYRGGVNRVGAGRVGVNRVGVNRVGVGRVGVGYGRGVGVGYGRGALAYRGGYYRPGLGLAAGAALGAAAAGYAGSGYYGNSGYGAYASAGYDTSGGDTYILRGNYMSEADAVAYCAQRFRSYDAESQTFLAYSGERVSCPQQ